jgi:hypothetical protein
MAATSEIRLKKSADLANLPAFPAVFVIVVPESETINWRYCRGIPSVSVVNLKAWLYILTVRQTIDHIVRFVCNPD